MSILEMTRFEHGGQWCEVWQLRHSMFDGIPCYEIDGRGDTQFYLGSGNDPLYIKERPDGWTIGYRPNDEDFDGYAARMVELGGWE